MALYWFVIKRAIVSIPLIFLIIVVNFAIIHLAPGDPVDFMVSGMEAVGLPPGYLEELRAKFGLDKPLHEQLLIYIYNVLRGDLGYSFIFRRPVLDIILSALGSTLLLTVTGFLISITLGIFIGIKCAEKPYSVFDNVASTSSLLIWSMPLFWLGMMLLLVFALYLGYFPAGGMYDVHATGYQRTLSVIRHLTLPAVCLGLGQFAVMTRFTRASMLEVLRSDYITTAWSKGCSPRTVYYRHAFRNALLPITTLLALRIRGLFMGSVVVETVFSWPGLGGLLYDSIMRRDFTLIMAIFIVYALLTIVSTLLSDLVYGYLDPRIRLESRAS